MEEPLSVLSPPNPGEFANAGAVFTYLPAAAQWATQCQSALRALPFDLEKRAPPLFRVPDYAGELVWRGAPLLVQCGTLMMMRRIRARWDSLFADHEDEAQWNTPMVVRLRCALLDQMLDVLAATRQSGEHLEARRQRAVLSQFKDPMDKLMEDLIHGPGDQSSKPSDKDWLDTLGAPDKPGDGD